MEKLIYLLSILFFFANPFIFSAQESAQVLPVNYKTRHAIFDYSENELNNTDSIPDFASKSNPLKITGTVFLSDGITPAKDVVLFINQPDENGNYELKKHLEKRYVHHRGWVKTNVDGKYTFYTFIPGSDRNSKALRSIHLVIKEPHGVEYSGNDFLFDNDPRLTNLCRKRLAKNGIDSILKPVKEGIMLVAIKDIILKKNPIEFANR
ncbi:MAG: hypothetical protein ABI295_09140 [Xanthomarina sp.]